MLTIDEITRGVRNAIADYPVKRVELFGSYAQKRQTAKSDVDLLIEFTSVAVSLLTLPLLRCCLEEELGVEVDIVHGPVAEDSFLDTARR